MAIAFGNNIGGYNDASYIAVNGKTVRQIILGEGKPKKELRLRDNSKYLYLGADRATEKWIPFCFDERTQPLNGFLDVNVIPRFDGDYTEKLKKISVRGYSYKYTGFHMLPDNIIISLFGLCTNTSPPTDYIEFSYVNGTITMIILDSTRNIKDDIWTSETNLQNATFSVNLYATDSYLYKNTKVKPRLHADIILDYPASPGHQNGQQEHRHVVYRSKNFDGSCPFLAYFFSERRKLTDCIIYSSLPTLTVGQTSTVNYFVDA